MQSDPQLREGEIEDYYESVDTTEIEEVQEWIPPIDLAREYNVGGGGGRLKITTSQSTLPRYRKFRSGHHL